jgi:hypothetical protein
MIEQPFSLRAFPAPKLPTISITGKFAFQNPVLTLHYSLTGNLEEVLLPPVSTGAGRKDELWKATCFEFFLATHDQPGYWEFNLSPSGAWNVYRMDAYRRVGFREEAAISQLPFEFKRKLDQFLLNISVDVTSIIQPDEGLELGITAIIQTRDGNETYWALTHPAPYPDFHLRESFTLGLAGQTHPSGQSAPGG